ncbi:serine-rich adhesin for platelets-like, partial [Prorops nasuta]|uniref:serine-rich adhesin for platelets-like n=1 Tax=Prorops nasuta TaxID=863751 RepID=UPI0034CE1A73
QKEDSRQTCVQQKTTSHIEQNKTNIQQDNKSVKQKNTITSALSKDENKSIADNSAECQDTRLNHSGQVVKRLNRLPKNLIKSFGSKNGTHRSLKNSFGQSETNTENDSSGNSLVEIKVESCKEYESESSTVLPVSNASNSMEINSDDKSICNQPKLGKKSQLDCNYVKSAPANDGANSSKLQYNKISVVEAVTKSTGLEETNVESGSRKDSEARKKFWKSMLSEEQDVRVEGKKATESSRKYLKTILSEERDVQVDSKNVSDARKKFWKSTLSEDQGVETSSKKVAEARRKFWKSARSEEQDIEVGSKKATEFWKSRSSKTKYNIVNKPNQMESRSDSLDTKVKSKIASCSKLGRSSLTIEPDKITINLSKYSPCASRLAASSKILSTDAITSPESPIHVSRSRSPSNIGVQTDDNSLKPPDRPAIQASLSLNIQQCQKSRSTSRSKSVGNSCVTSPTSDGTTLSYSPTGTEVLSLEEVGSQTSSTEGSGSSSDIKGRLQVEYSNKIRRATLETKC